MRNSDLIGLESGLGTYYSVMGLYRHSLLKAKNVSVMSLTGTLSPTNLNGSDGI